MWDEIIDKLPSIILGAYFLFKKYMPESNISSSTPNSSVTQKEFDELDEKVNDMDKDVRNHSNRISNLEGRLSK